MGPLWTLRPGQSRAAPFPLTQPDTFTAHLELTCPRGPDSLPRSRKHDKNSPSPHPLPLSRFSDPHVYLCATDSRFWDSCLISFKSIPNAHVNRLHHFLFSNFFRTRFFFDWQIRKSPSGGENTSHFAGRALCFISCVISNYTWGDVGCIYSMVT